MANVSSSNGIEYLPKIRFSGFPFEWEDCVLSTVLAERKEYCEKDGTYEHATLSKDGIYGKTERYNRDFLVSDENKAYKITHRWDLCYNPANLKFGVICLNTYGDAIFSPIYVTFDISESFSKEFIGYALSRWDFINRALRFQQGTVYERMAVSPEDFLTIHCRFPKLKEQEKIADFLRLIDQRIAKQSEHVEHLKKYKRGLLQAIFSREVQLENLSNWEHRLFSEIASLGKGKYTPKQEEALPCIELEHLEQQTGQIIGYANSNEQNSVKSVFHKGDVLFGKLRPYLRKFALPEYDGVCSSEIWVLHPESNIDSTFLFYLIQSESFIAAANISSGTKMPRAEWSKVSNESFFIPELSEQKRIADLFSAIDKRIVNASRSVNKMQSLKQGLLQQLFI